MSTPIKHCAVYTRKSTEEGLEQSFNSLDAQQEACHAYIISQKSQGWVAVKEQYDDGGFSGGNMDRPALKKLLDDIKAKKINIIVVYKIDRLTRSLPDFARLIEVLEKYGVTFISVTQSFNTTTSMGRLMLNVLLSFAQFEREVTTERIRDKVSASKKKGIWMGGTLPTGYSVKNRLLIENGDADVIRMLYTRYLELGSILLLEEDLKRRGIKSPVRTLANGKQVGGYTFMRGALRHILSNPIYIGKIKHKTQIYDGLQASIVPIDQWQRVQEKLTSHSHQFLREKRFSADPARLEGKLFDMEGNRYASANTAKHGKQHRYYFSNNLFKKYKGHPREEAARVAALEVEGHVQKVIREHLCDADKLNSILQIDPEKTLPILQLITDNAHKLTHAGCAIKKVVIEGDSLRVEIQVSKLCQYIDYELKLDSSAVAMDSVFKLTTRFHNSRATRKTLILEPEAIPNKPGDIFDLEAKELKNFIRGIVWRDEHFRGESIRQISLREKVSEGLVKTLIHNSFDINGPYAYKR